ncbi:glycosyltransferase [Myroides marinus]|uniref:glycosyltransferase n=1 Tax=Myroides marinus TaxID=703342 RepID=UPI00257902DA|nr:glycosyltransferase [Myroides marinus]MDM1355970.1 glycosyltransferase [Myroides marinus]
MKITVIGNFGYASGKLDGQTVKTRSLYTLLETNSSLIKDLKYYDTSLLKNNKMLFFSLSKDVVTSDKIFYLPAQNSLRFFFPFLFVFCKICNTKINYFVVGGWLKDLLTSHKYLQIMLSKIECIFSETYIIKKELEKSFKFKNVSYFPNFRSCYYSPTFNKVDVDSVRLVYVGRINENKGISDLCLVLNDLRKIGVVNFIIDLYGQVDSVYQEEFNILLEKFEFISYKGALNPQEIYDVVGKYDLMLFPTKYYTEGLPGTVLDAYLSGVPVIGSGWKHSEEFIVNRVTGFIYGFNDLNGFKNLMIEILSDGSILNEMKIQAWKKSREFAEDYALSILKKSLI